MNWQFRQERWHAKWPAFAQRSNSDLQFEGKKVLLLVHMIALKYENTLVILTSNNKFQNEYISINGFHVSVPRGTKLKEHIVIGTPGKVLDWGIKYKYFDVSKISVFVLDEADLMISTQGHQDQVFRIRK